MQRMAATRIQSFSHGTPDYQIGQWIDSMITDAEQHLAAMGAEHVCNPQITAIPMGTATIVHVLAIGLKGAPPGDEDDEDAPVEEPPQKKRRRRQPRSPLPPWVN